ncbi:Quiescin Q6 sulfhydryl oxidase [Perkinsus olseni]|uniref:Quiescin Q6 sulfhydryl oxidase n=2 Tax=Perkinsus olseni TaxID=32597 RepID=A0A7J6NGG2_PEROL|nr:Quiescin Q6 sulfhydryl oxidase [Perkinsus olseni]
MTATVSPSNITLNEIIDFNDELTKGLPVAAPKEVDQKDALLRNGRLLVTPPGLTKASFLHALALEGGVFTTMRTTFNATRILSLDRHIKRLSAAYVDTDDAAELDTLGRKVKEMCLTGIAALNGHAKDENFEAQVTVGITYKVKDMWMFLCPLPVHKNSRCVAELARGERSGNVHVKDVSWTERRKAISERMATGVEEMVMVGSNDRVTEGLSSNVAFVANGKVYTAGEDKVLSGTIRELLLEACRDHDIKVVFETVSVEMARRPDVEMLIMSTSRLVLSVQKLIIPGDFNENGEVVVVEHPVESQLVSSLKAWVKGKVEVDSFPLEDYEEI